MLNPAAVFVNGQISIFSLVAHKLDHVLDFGHDFVVDDRKCPFNFNARDFLRR